MTRVRKPSRATEIRMHKEELRKKIESDHRLKRDFDFLIEKTGLQPSQLLTGLWLDCNMMKASRQTLLCSAREEMWPISEDTLRRTIKSIRNVARQIEATNKTDFSPLRTLKNIGVKFVRLSEDLGDYATELQRKVDIVSRYWKGKRARTPALVSLTRQHSVYERIRSSAGSYHQTRLLRLLNVARNVQGYPKIRNRAFAIWLNRLEKRRNENE